MINDFLAKLDNDPVAPHGFIWPSFTARTISPAEQTVRAAVIGVNLSREGKFSRCLQLLNLVEESPSSGLITLNDDRITYSKAVLRARFGLSGTVVEYTGSNETAPALNLVVTANTPDITSYLAEMLDSSSIRISDDLGNSVTRTVTMSGGISNQLQVPNGVAYFLLTGVDPAVGDKWNISFQKPGANWLPLAMARSQTANVKAIMSSELSHLFDRSILQLDKLAVVIAAIGTHA